MLLTIKVKLFLKLILLFLLSILFKYKNKCKEYFNNNYKNAIVVLTKGYEHNSDYDMLINRNRSIYNKYYIHLNKDKYDIVIFHEGNITLPQQEYIQNQTPKLPIIFKEVKLYLNEESNNECPSTGLSNRFSLGYKGMCHFWSIDFLKYLKDYEYIFRIDEDCIIDNIKDINFIDKYKEKNIYFSSTLFQGKDHPDVVIGLENLFEIYIKNNNIIPFKSMNSIKCPYTNVMIVNIPYFNSHNDVINILKIIDDSNCIFSNRWGDLPIWGYILSVLIDEKYYKEEKDVSYIHGSHDNVKIN